MPSSPSNKSPKSSEKSSPASKTLMRKTVTVLAALAAALVVAGALLVVFVIAVMLPHLPDLKAITEYQPKVPMRIYTADKVLIGEFGEERRSLMRLPDIPANMKNAVLAIEDARFYQHGGIDVLGLLRASVADLMHGGASQGASTITMQVARNMFLSREKTYSRKIYEILLAYRIEAALTKDQILEIYMNQIFLGQRSFGFAAASRAYFGKDLREVTLAEAAMLAGLPKAPSAYNPIVNPKRARIRQEYILKRMRDLGFITPEQYDSAMKEPLRLRSKSNVYKVHAEYIAEMVRQMMYAQFQDDIYTKGFNVYTTITSADQEAAYDAVRKGVFAYDARHGYRGPEAHIVLPPEGEERDNAIDAALDARTDNDDIVPAVVLSADAKQVKVKMRDDDIVTLEGSDLRLATAALSPKARKEIQITPGSVIRLRPTAQADRAADKAAETGTKAPESDAKHQWQITQLPQVEATFVSMLPDTGGIRSLVGGFDFQQNKYNHVMQAERQPGSSFKPFIYSAALEKGFGPASIINDAPVSYPGGPGQPMWEPKDDDQPDGPMSLRVALQKSKNLVSIRMLDSIGVKYAQEFVTTRFGFDKSRTPPYLPLALGAGQVTPIQLVTAYAVFANGGYRVNPYLIGTVTDALGNVMSEAKPITAGKDAPRTIDARNAYIMTSLLQSVAQRGTGAGTNVLKRTDLAGKTGTTNDAMDGWFAGFQRSLVAVAWMGYDQPRSLGSREFGAELALPIWVEYMSRALKGVPQFSPPAPQGIVMLNGEPYYDNLVPGNGFVASLGVGQALTMGPDGVPVPVLPNSPGALTEYGTPAGTGPAQSRGVGGSAADEQERQSVMRLFGGH